VILLDPVFTRVSSAPARVQAPARVAFALCKAIYIVLSNKNWSLASGSKRGWKMQKRVIVKIKKDNTELSLREVLEKIKEIQDQHPDLDIFFDGDEYAICSRPRKASL